MAISYTKLINMIPRKTPPSFLADSILEKVELFEERRSRIYAITFSLISLISATSLIPLFLLVFQELNSSGFTEFISLTISDTSYAFNNWKVLLLSVTSSLPLFNVTLFIGLMLIFILSLRRFISYASSLSIYHKHSAISSA